MMSVLYKWMRALDFSDPVVWIFLPTPLSLEISDSLIKKLSIYYCIDNFSVSSVSAKKVRRSEEKLLKKADLVFVTSKELYSRCNKHNEKVHIFPFAVNFSEFQNIRATQQPVPQDLKDIKPPILGYVGGVHKWIDQGLIKSLAVQHPEYSFVFVGPIQTDVGMLSDAGNIYFLGNKDHYQIPLYIKNFNICLIPYLITDYTKNVYPTKLNEYLAMGKPVVSTLLPEVAGFNRDYKAVVYTAADKQDFDRCIVNAIEDNEPDVERRRIEAAAENSWERRIEEMSILIEKQIDAKRLDENRLWREKLLYFYKTARRRSFKIAVICCFIYIAVFKTQLIWFLSGPLGISQPPQKTDAITVFGGGVGETGSPGKSTIERARYAAGLYRGRYADKIIFSSGYTYTYNDAENMRLIAISEGVLEKDIILEQKANSTYENVLFVKNILEEHKWRSILLVSSLYNMRRAALVFDRHCAGVKVFYAPVKNSQFYNKSAGVRLEQIRAIIHEYLGILYYWVKGYI